MPDSAEPPDPISGIGNPHSLNKCKISKVWRSFCYTRGGIFSSNAEVFLIEIFGMSDTIIPARFYLTKEGYFMYKLQGYFDDYAVIEYCGEINAK